MYTHILWDGIRHRSGERAKYESFFWEGAALRPIQALQAPIALPGAGWRNGFAAVGIDPFRP